MTRRFPPDAPPAPVQQRSAGRRRRSTRPDATVRHRLPRLAALLGAAAVLTACGVGGSGSDAASSGDQAPAPAGADSPVGDGEAGSDQSGDSSADAAEEADAPTTADRAAAGADRSRQVVQSVELSLRSADVAASARAIGDDVTRLGGYVVAESSPDADRTRLEIRVPAPDLEGFLGRVEGRDELQDRSRSAEDVTDRVVDTASRIDSQRVSIERLRTLLEDAGGVTDVLDVERELADREAELDALLSAQQSLEDQVQLASVGITLNAPPSAPGPSPGTDGFLGGLGDGWDGMQALLGTMATVTGVVLPFVVLLGGIGALVLLGVRRWRRRPGHDRSTRPADHGTGAAAQEPNERTTSTTPASTSGSVPGGTP